LERNPPDKSPPPQPEPQDLSSNDLMREGINQLPGALIDGALHALSGALSIAGRTVRDPFSAVAGAVDYARSGVRVMSQAAEPSPLLRRRSLTSRSQALDIRLADLHRAAKAGGGSINDAYLAALCGALGRYHRALGVPIATLPMAVPVNLRADADAAGGNRFTGVNLAAPVGLIEPVERMKRIRAHMTQRRDEPAMDLLGSVAPLLSVLPASMLEMVTGSVVASDVQASNVPFYPGDTYISGAKVLRHYGLGPLPGVAMMVVLISRGGCATITVRYDRASVRDEKLFAGCLVEGFDEILALAGEPVPHCAPASFDYPQSSSRSAAGS
jgi:WS/DGAT/MGAT family acyltransferase